MTMPTKRFQPLWGTEGFFLNSFPEDMYIEEIIEDDFDPTYHDILSSLRREEGDLE